MQIATIALIQERQRHAGSFLVRHVPYVNNIGGGARGQCYSNSHAVKTAQGRNVIMVSGWLVQPYDEKSNSTAIIQHWWNADKSGNHFDTSPFITNQEEYVQDAGIISFCVENDHLLTTHLAHSLLYRDGKFEVLTDPDRMLFRPVNELRTEYLYGIS